MEIDRRVFIASLGGTTAVSLMSSEAKADALEHWMEDSLDQQAAAGQGAAPKPTNYKGLEITPLGIERAQNVPLVDRCLITNARSPSACRLGRRSPRCRSTRPSSTSLRSTRSS